MQRKTLKDFHNKLSWNTKLYTLLAIVVAIVAKFSNAMNTNFALTIIIGLLVILFVESFAIISVKHPVVWGYIKWIIFLAVLAMVLLAIS
ncbi:MAG: hypothetical protein HKN76_14800 [Saprospiraceae bacterium]|nr:hypothetical protein [Saprospiraceae bacterium]